MQVEQMIDIHAPDGLIASQIQSRGLNFPVTSKIVESFAAKNAGPKTLASLREQIRVGTLQIQTEPGSQILMDGKNAGSAGTDGILVLQDVPAGNHELVARKDGYKDVNVQFALAKNENKPLPLPLKWLGGFLSVSAQPQGATVSVAGPISLENGAKDIPCPPGGYTATVSLQGYLTQTRTFQVAAGEHHAETFQLVVDPAVLTRELSDAQSKLQAGDPVRATSLADAVLKQQPGSPDAEAVLAEAAFQLGEMNRFVDAGTKAIWGGKPVTVSVMHVHMGWRLTIHPVNLTISESGIAFIADPPDSHCKIPSSLGFDLIRTMSVQRDPVGYIELQIQYSSQAHSNFIVHDLRFVVNGSTLGSPPGTIEVFGPSIIQSPNSAAQTLDGIDRLMVRAKR
ncbi:MAG: PEGA domain-containing protein [Sulfobacillus sp.]